MRPSRSGGVLALVAAVLLATLAVVQAQPCPTLVTWTKARAVGRSIKAKIVVGNPDTTRSIDNVVLRVGLPSPTDVVSVKGTASPARSKGRRVAVRNVGDAVFFLNMHFKPRQKRKFVVTGRLVTCEPKTLAFTSLTYLVSPANDTASCPSPPRATSVYAPAPKRKKRGCTPLTPSPTAAGSNGTDIGFEPFGVGQRCLEAGRQAPFDSRRRALAWSPSSSSSSNHRLVLNSKAHKDLRMALAVIETPTQCWQYCSNFDSTPAPFFFNWNTATSTCFCCGG